MPLSRIALEREDIRRISAELKDLVDLIGLAAQDRLSPEQLGVLCRIYTRRGWPTQKALIRTLLKRARADAAGVIRQHIAAEKKALPDIVAKVEQLLSNTVKKRVQWRYDRARALEANVRQGVRGLEGVLQTIQ